MGMEAPSDGFLMELGSSGNFVPRSALFLRNEAIAGGRDGKFLGLRAFISFLEDFYLLKRRRRKKKHQDAKRQASGRRGLLPREKL